jgi:hypothetical protein
MNRLVSPAGIGVIALAILLFAGGAWAQAPGTGRIQGRVVDAVSGRSLPGAQVTVEGTSSTGVSDADGGYSFEAVPAGAQTLRVSLLGYGTKLVTEVTVRPGQTTEQSISLSAEAVALEGLTVTATRERGSIRRALDGQRTAVGVINATTSEEIARSPDSDAAQAVRRVSGVTVRDGKYVFVRGLGERYTTTSLNGARIPSPEPEKKTVPLDLFPSSLLESITTSKTFTPDQPGDFSGAQVNLKTRSFPSQRELAYSFSTGVSTSGMGGQGVRAPSAGMEWLGFAAGNRQLPRPVAAISDFSRLQPSQVNQLVRSFRDSWTPAGTGTLPNASLGVSGGGHDEVLGRRLGVVGSLSYSRSDEVRRDEIRARAVAADEGGSTRANNAFRGSTGQSSAAWGGMLNLGTYLGDNHQLQLNNSYNRTADNEAHVDWGTLEEFAQVDSVQRTSLRYVERSILSSQLRGEHQLGLAQRLDWSFTGSQVQRAEPDRSDLAYGYEFAPTGERLPLAWLGFIPEAAKRTYANLSERGVDGAVDYTHNFGTAGEEGALKVGTALRRVARDATSASYNLRAVGLSAEERALPPEEIFGGAFTAGSTAKITLEPNASGGSYTAEDQVGALYAMVDLPVTPWLRMAGGGRLENWRLRLDSEPTSRGLIHTRRENTDLLPSLALNFRVSDYQNVRLSASQTLARPEYRELSPISYRDMLGEREVFGDSSLVRTLVRNFDARWEWYPTAGEVLSVALFAKQFKHPIEPIDVATSGASQLSFTNAEGAENFGIELEARKRLDFLAESLDGFTGFANATLMRSQIRTGNSQLSALTNSDRPMAGQAPYVVNAGLSYDAPESELRATLLYNVVGPRITSAAVVPIRVDSYEQTRQGLDFSLRFPLGGGAVAKLDARNLLDSAYEERQGDVIRHRYTTGRLLSVGATWQP